MESSSQSIPDTPEAQAVDLGTIADPEAGDAAPSQSPSTGPVHEAVAAVEVRKRTCVAGSRPVDNAKRDAIEAMHRKGAMKAKDCGHGYYVCMSVNCDAECSIQKCKTGNEYVQFFYFVSFKRSSTCFCAPTADAILQFSFFCKT